jgi:hypothetical protein
MILMDKEMKDSRISVLIHLVAGVAIGLLSTFLGMALYALGVAIVVAIVLGHMTERAVGKKKFSWWIGNGLFIYLFAWVDVWIFVVNYF